MEISAADSTGLKWGILGAGGIARAFASDLHTTGRPIAAVAARSFDRASAFAAEYGVDSAYGSYEELVADPQVDAIYIATIHPEHASGARLALEAGKHVLVEKPFTMNAAQARELVDLAADHKLVILEAMWTRWLPHMVRMREVLNQGILGDVRTLFAEFSVRNADADRMARKELGGGALLDLGIYPVSLAWDVLGEPSSIWARGQLTAVEQVDAETTIVLGYPTGATAILHAQMTARGAVSASIVGTEGRIDFDPMWFAVPAFTRFVEDEIVERFEAGIAGRGMQFQAAELERLVAARILGGEILPPAETVAIMETLDEVRAQIGLAF